MKLKTCLALAAAIACLGAASANAGVNPSLLGVPTFNSGSFVFTYQGTLSGDVGLTQGSKLVIYDFAGYVPGSIFSPSPNLLTSVELLTPVTPGFAQIPGQVDDPTLFNLVFTWNGPDFQVSGGPFLPVDFNGLGARSIFGGETSDTFAAITVKNNPDGVPGGTEYPNFEQGFITVPAAVPEPATWGMMILGMGMIGAGLRLRRRSALPASV